MYLYVIPFLHGLRERELAEGAVQPELAWINCLYIYNNYTKLSDKSKMEVNANIDRQILILEYWK